MMIKNQFKLLKILNSFFLTETYKKFNKRLTPIFDNTAEAIVPSVLS